jgi:hypothetical protein
MTFRPKPSELTSQWYVKFFGSNTTRADRSLGILDEVKRSGNHFACTYPRGRRPRAVRDGAVIYSKRRLMAVCTVRFPAFMLFV